MYVCKHGAYNPFEGCRRCGIPPAPASSRLLTWRQIRELVQAGETRVRDNPGIHEADDAELDAIADEVLK